MHMILQIEASGRVRVIPLQTDLMRTVHTVVDWPSATLLPGGDRWCRLTGCDDTVALGRPTASGPYNRIATELSDDTPVRGTVVLLREQPHDLYGMSGWSDAAARHIICRLLRYPGVWL